MIAYGLVIREHTKGGGMWSNAACAVKVGDRTILEINGLSIIYVALTAYTHVYTHTKQVDGIG